MSTLFYLADWGVAEKVLRLQSRSAVSVMRARTLVRPVVVQPAIGRRTDHECIRFGQRAMNRMRIGPRRDQLAAHRQSVGRNDWGLELAAQRSDDARNPGRPTCVRSAKGEDDGRCSQALQACSIALLIRCQLIGLDFDISDRKEMAKKWQISLKLCLPPALSAS